MLVLSASLVLDEVRSGVKKPSVIRRKLISGYADQQIMVGIGIQSVGLVKAAAVVPYHFFLIWMLSLLSTATHNAALLAALARGDAGRDRVLRWMRQVLMLVNLVLSCAYGVFVLQAKRRGLPATLPIGCVWQNLDPDSSAVAEEKPTAGGLDYVGTIATVAGNCVVFGLATWYLQSRRRPARFYRIVQFVGLLLMAAIAIGMSDSTSA